MRFEAFNILCLGYFNQHHIFGKKQPFKQELGFWERRRSGSKQLDLCFGQLPPPCQSGEKVC